MLAILVCYKLHLNLQFSKWDNIFLVITHSLFLNYIPIDTITILEIFSIRFRPSPCWHKKCITYFTFQAQAPGWPPPWWCIQGTLSTMWDCVHIQSCIFSCVPGITHHQWKTLHWWVLILLIYLIYPTVKVIRMSPPYLLQIISKIYDLTTISIFHILMFLFLDFSKWRRCDHDCQWVPTYPCGTDGHKVHVLWRGMWCMCGVCYIPWWQTTQTENHCLQLSKKDDKHCIYWNLLSTLI